MRLIDADALYTLFVKMKSFGELTAKKAIRCVEEAPTVDAVPVIRCKDCALWDDADSEHLVGYCTEGDGRLPSNGEKITFRNEWCCWAERKEE